MRFRGAIVGDLFGTQCQTVVPCPGLHIKRRLDDPAVELVGVRMDKVLVNRKPEAVGDFSGVRGDGEADGSQPADKVDIRLPVPIPVPVAKTDQRREGGTDAGLFFHFPDHRVGDVLAGKQCSAGEFQMPVGVVALLDDEQLPVVGKDDTSGPDVVSGERWDVRPVLKGEGQLQPLGGRVVISEPFGNRKGNEVGVGDGELKPDDFHPLSTPCLKRITQSGGEFVTVTGHVLWVDDPSAKWIGVCDKEIHTVRRYEKSPAPTTAGLLTPGRKKPRVPVERPDHDPVPERSHMSGKILNPATQEPVADHKTHTPEDARNAVLTARVAQSEWAVTPVRVRAGVLGGLTRHIVENADRMAQVISDCTGKPRVDALSTEILAAAIMSRYYPRKAARFLRPRRLGASSPIFLNKKSMLFRVPYGVIGIISPWNYPLGIPLHDVISALLAGNAVILKVATQVQPVGEIIREMMEAVHLPEGLFHLLHLPGQIAGDALLDAPVDKLLFTGSNRVGRELATKAGERLIPIGLELGGNDAMIVLEDANLHRAAAGAVWAGLSNTGQSCGAVERIYVVDQVYDRFLATLKPMFQRLRSGPDTDHEVALGALTTPRQLETVRAHLGEALRLGAREVARSQMDAAAGAAFHPAVVVEDAGHHLALMQHETFGPILAVHRVAGTEEALRLANDSYLGLSGSIWTGNRKLGRALAR
ncbi:MAG: aldehyde dehydrogenase family protein, partial [Spirochaetales bacterium]